MTISARLFVTKALAFGGILALQPHAGAPATARSPDTQLHGHQPDALAQVVPAPDSSSSPLRDKTLVAWVHPANTTQRGGSVVTLMEGEDFDAVVLGERVPGRWMAGSDFFRRIQGEEEQKGSLIEFYLDDLLMQCSSLPQKATGRIGILQAGDPAACTVLKAWRPGELQP